MPDKLQSRKKKFFFGFSDGNTLSILLRALDMN